MKHAIVVVVTVTGCGRLGFDPEVLLDATATARCDPEQPFGPLVALPRLSSPGADIGVELADDGLTGFMWSDRLGIDRIYETSRTTRDAELATPRLVDALIAPGYADRDPCPSGDGLSLVFASQRPGGGGGGWDLWLATRASRAAELEAPTPVTATNNAAENWGPYLTSSGLALYYVEGADLRVSRRASTSDEFTTVSVLGTLNTSFSEFEPTVTPDELTIYFASDRGGRGLDLYVATRASIDASFDEPTLVGELSSGADDIPSWVAPDLCEIQMTQSNGATGWDLYYARRPL
ncbi:MAG TPA: hypothetical protein VIU61_13205 [Kofleriaceae bacterium]